jgi:arabinose-5-phosphate isomerase
VNTTPGDEDVEAVTRRVLEVGRRTLSVEAAVLADLGQQLGDAFLRAVEILSTASGRVIVTGMGKSGIISHKIAATLASTGSPALFLHPAEAIHGDLGMITKDDVVLAISNSGETAEILALLPSLELLSVPTVCITRKPESSLGSFADCTLSLPVSEEGCPIGLAPMASTTASLALGDALAAGLMELRGFQPEDFAVFHPGGSLGRRLLTRVRDLMIPLAEVHAVASDTPMRDVVREMISINLGAILIVGEDAGLAGILTDGDLKRIYDELHGREQEPVSEFMNTSPTTCPPDVLAERALLTMEERAGGQITVLPVVDGEGRALGLIRLHDILKAKIK